jgi:hypothetical protein
MPPLMPQQWVVIWVALLVIAWFLLSFYILWRHYQHHKHKARRMILTATNIRPKEN